MIARLWQFIAGYVKIKIEGLKLLQFINDAAQRGIALKAADRHGYSRVTAEVTWRDYRRLLALAVNRPLRVVAVTSGGLPHIAGLAVKRLAFTLGLVFCVTALIAANGFVFDVRVAGCTAPGLEQRAYAILDGQGLKPGAAKSAFDLHACENALILGLPEIAFAAIRVNGVVATVNIVEGERPPEILDRNTPCNVVAARDAVVRKVVVFEGASKVAPGDAVRRGQVLVDGVQALEDGVRLVHARAEVTASVWYEGRGSAPLFAETKQRTGQSARRSHLTFAGFTMPVDQDGKAEFPDFETESRTYCLLGPGLKGPKLVVETDHETVGRMRAFAFEEARQQAFLKAMDAVHPLLPEGADMADSRTVYGYEGGAVTATVYIETLQNIAVEQKIG